MASQSGQRDLTQLIDTFALAHDKLAEETRRVVSKGAWNIKRDWRNAWRDRPKTKGLFLTIDYDIIERPGVIAGEIGPSPVPGGIAVGKGVASLGGIIEEGTVNNAPHPGGAPALKKELPLFEDALSAMGKSLLDGE